VLATSDIDGLPHAILTYVTAGSGLGFNRAVLFLPNAAEAELVAAMAIGPATSEEAHATWVRLAHEQRTLVELLQKAGAADAESGLSALVRGVSIPLATTPEGARHPLAVAYAAGQVRKIVDARTLDGFAPRLRGVFCGTEVVCIPLVARERAIGLIVADNAFNREPIDEERIHFLELLASLAGLTLDNSRMYGRLEAQARELGTALDELKAAQDRLLHNRTPSTSGSAVRRVSTTGRMSARSTRTSRPPWIFSRPSAGSTSSLTSGPSVTTVDSIRRQSSGAPENSRPGRATASSRRGASSPAAAWSARCSRPESASAPAPR
jgi:hypothetical protein